MQSLILSSISLFLLSCSSYHSDIFVYQNQAYSSKKFTEFEIKHYKNYGNRNFQLVLNSNDNKDLEKQLSNKCEEQEVDCRFLLLDENLKQSTERIIESYNHFKKSKFFLYSPDSNTMARYLGAINLLVHQGNEKSLENILNELAIDEKEALTTEILKLRH